MEPLPSRPTRHHRHPKDSTALLMSVIRSMLASESNEHRDKEKSKLEREFRRSDQKVDELIAVHHKDLTAVMTTFRNVNGRLAATRERLHSIIVNLESCKQLLNCKRSELKRLWLEGIEHKQTLFLLTQIDNLKDVPEKVERYVTRKHYLHATDLLVTSMTTLKCDLEGVDALKEVWAELQSKQKSLQDVLVEELNRHLYIRSTSEVLASLIPPSLQRQGSSRSGIPGESAGKRTVIESPAITPTHKYKQRRDAAVTPTAAATPAFFDENEVRVPITEDLLVSDPEEDSFHFIAILIECLSRLQKLPEAVESMKNRMQPELGAVVRNTAQQLCDARLGGNTHPTTNQPRLLLELLELSMDQFRRIAMMHQCVLANLRYVLTSHDQQGDVSLYEMADYWSRVQTVLQGMLSDYLDIEHASVGPVEGPSFKDTVQDINMYFSKKKPPRQKRVALFKFENSSHAMSLHSYMKEQQMFGSMEMLHMRESGAGNEERVLLCQADARNITVVFIVLMRFVSDIETALGVPKGIPCALHAFITDFVKDVFLGRIHGEAVTGIETATKSVDAWKAHTDVATQRVLNVPCPLLQSTVYVEQRIEELQVLMQDLPAYAENFLNIVVKLLYTYKEMCQAAYGGIVQPESEDKRIISATWAKDEDINRFLR